MRTATKRATVYLDTDLHKALRFKAVEMSRSISDLINEAIRTIPRGRCGGYRSI